MKHLIQRTARISLSLFLFAVILGGALFISSAKASPVNLVSNPGFENFCSGLPCNWSKAAGDESAFSSSTVAHTGAFSLLVTGYSTRGAVSTCVSGIPANALIAIDYWFNAQSSGVTNGYGVGQFYSDSNCNTNIGNYSFSGYGPSNPGSWVLSHSEYTSPAGTNSARFQIIAGCGGFSSACPATVLYDDVSVTILSVSCPAGQYDNGGNCVDASPGYYVPAPGAAEQIACPVGTYQDLAGATSCKPTPAGRYVADEGQIQAMLCPVGTYQPNEGSASCMLADAGYFVDTTGAVTQTMCPAGFTSEAGAVACYLANSAPTVDAGGPYSGNEGSAIALSGASALDPDGDALTYNWSVDSTLCSFDDASALNPNLTCSDNGSFNATLEVHEVNGLIMTMYDTNDPLGAVANGFAGLTPGTFSVTTAGGSISTDSTIVPVVNFPETTPIDLYSFFNVGSNGSVDPGSTYAEPQGDDISIQPPGGNDYFGASFTGYLYLPTGGDVTFQVGIDDAFVLQVNGGTVAQYLGPTDFAYFSGTAVGLSAGYVPITLNYGELTGGANIVLLSASGGGLPGGVIPQAYLFVNPPQSDSAEVTVNNVAPSLDVISLDQSLVPVNTEISATAVFTDPGVLDIHTAAWAWGDGSATAGTVTQDAGYGSVDDSHSFSEPGVYTLQLTVADDDGGVSNESVYQYLVVYDPSGGFVTGGGWIDSPEGAYTADPSLSGKASFGFVAKYKKGAIVPDGNTQFQFKAGDLNFHSNSYQWLVVAGARAQFKGEGTINGAGNYGFMLTAIDGAINGGGGVDKFRIKIWDLDNGDAVVYDNLMGGADDAAPTTELGGGSIVIHNK